MSQKIVISECIEQETGKAVSGCEHDKTFVITDETTREHCLPLIANAEGIKDAEVISIKPSDLNKNAENSHGREHGWFVAYGPFDNPNIAVAVIVENAGYGATSAVPIGHKILTAAFGLDQPQQNAAAPAQTQAQP